MSSVFAAPNILNLNPLIIFFIESYRCYTFEVLVNEILLPLSRDFRCHRGLHHSVLGMGGLLQFEQALLYELLVRDVVVLTLQPEIALVTELLEQPVLCNETAF